MILIPIYNEEKRLSEKKYQAFLIENKDKILCVYVPSLDESLSLIKKIGVDFVKLKDRQSIGSSVEFAIKEKKLESVMVLPCDVNIQKEHFECYEKFKKQKYIWGGFLKTYNNKGFFLSLYLSILNLRASYMSGLVWTNVMMFKTEAFFRAYKKECFLEDVLLSDYLKNVEKPVVFKNKVVVSARKYEANKSQMIKNILIMFAYRTKIFSIERLRNFYL